MSATNTLRIGALLGCAAWLVAGSAHAQQAVPGQVLPGQSPTERQPAGQYDRQHAQAGNASQQVDQFLANCLLAKNEAEIKISELATQEAQNAKVKQFAEKMVRDHREISKKLQQVAGSQMTTQGRSPQSATGANNSGQSNQPNQPGARSDQTTQGVPGSQTDARRGNASGAQGDSFQQLTRIEQQITEKATEAVTEKLRDKSGAGFDQAYLGCQVGAHLQMKAALEVIGQQTSGKLAEIAKEAKSKVDQHLQEAEKLMEQTEGDARQASRPEDSRRQQ